MPKRSKRFEVAEDPLITAVHEGSLGLVQQIVSKSGLNFCETWLEGYALLCIAIKRYRSQLALWLISQNCRVNRINNEDTSDTPLHLAAYNDEDAVITNLLEKSACINAKNKYGETPLHISCRKRNMVITKLLLKDDTIADIPDNYSTTPLHVAVEQEWLEGVKLLLSHKVTVNANTIKDDFKGYTPLHIAIQKKNRDIVKILLENGANIAATIGISEIDSSQQNKLNCVNYGTYMPLHLAAEMNDDNMIKLLIDQGADVNAVVEDNGFTPLHIAIQNKNKKNFNLLSNHKADTKAKTKEGKNVLHLAVENDWPEFVESFLVRSIDRFDVNDQTSDGETSLYMAVEMGDEDMIELLLKYNADVNLKNLKSQSPLHVAAEFSAEIVKILLNEGANVDEVDIDNKTPLCIAVKQGDLEIVTQLLQYKPSIHNNSNRSAFIFAIRNNNSSYVNIVNLLLEYGFAIIAEDVNDTDLLYDSVSQGYVKIVKHLLEHGINLSSDSKNKKNNLLLHNAIKSQNGEMAELLIKHKCNLNAVDAHGQTPVGYAIEHNNLNLLALLLTNGAQIENIAFPLLAAAKDNNISLIEYLIKYGGDINVRDEFGTTALHFATWNKQSRFVKFLLSKQAYVNTTEVTINKVITNDTNSEDSYTKEFRKRVFTSPLHIAVSKKSKEICVTLLEYYANVNSKDGYGRTALHIASAIKSTKQKDLIKTLISYGADINALDDFNRLPIYYIYNQTCVCSIAFQNQYEVYSECECDLYEDYDINDVIDIFVKYIALFTCMKKSIHADNLKIISKSNFFEKLQISCLAELAKMKEEKICDYVSVYDILVKKSNSLAAYACNEDIIDAFESSNYKSKFPLYCDLLKEQFDIATNRKCLLDSAVSSFNSLLKFKLPEIITEKIFDLLHLNDLSSIAKASEDYDSKNYNHMSPSKKLKVYR